MKKFVLNTIYYLVVLAATPLILSVAILIAAFFIAYMYVGLMIYLPYEAFRDWLKKRSLKNKEKKEWAVQTNP